MQTSLKFGVKVLTSVKSSASGTSHCLIRRESTPVSEEEIVSMVEEEAK
jgi:hypothetical protein